MTDPKKKPLTDTINSTGIQIKGLGTIISVIGAIILSVGVVVKYILKES